MVLCARKQCVRSRGLLCWQRFCCHMRPVVLYSHVAAGARGGGILLLAKGARGKYVAFAMPCVCMACALCHCGQQRVEKRDQRERFSPTALIVNPLFRKEG
ncbi:MAG: hypothetical protein PHN64_07320 [Desulfovibrionaceae bacterium]|nr:hypothetical protein [Desulfovibrionaceae bacterium]